MKIEETHNSIKLIPEDNWEKDKLKVLRSKSIGKLQFQDDWDQTGYLELCYEPHPWDRR